MSTTTPSTDAIAVLAYAYWEADGRPDGKDIDHWLKAEQTLATPQVKEPRVLHAATANQHRRGPAATNLRHA